MIAYKIVFGPDLTYWHGRGEDVSTASGGNVIRYNELEELSAGVRTVILLTTKILVHGVGGFARAENGIAHGGAPSTGIGAFYKDHHTEGYKLGGGAEYSLSKHFLNASYRYSNYGEHTSRERAKLVASVRF